ncbi:MAG: cell envelope integrity protein TolA [Bacteroidota bacterium]
MEQTLPYRYPGTRPFTRKDRYLFFGREHDCQKLTELILKEQLVLLFGKSGYGKSSLLNAGVIPLLEEEWQFHIHNIRLNNPEMSPTDIILHHLSSQVEGSDYLSEAFNFAKEVPNDAASVVWYYLKRSELNVNESQATLLIFDQFEELFNYSNLRIEQFGRVIAALLSKSLPAAVKKLIKEKIKSGTFSEDQMDFLLRPLNLKILFSIRSDRLGLFSKLKNFLPGIFNGTYGLQPLSRQQAREALLQPAMKPGQFASPPFSYRDNAIATVMDSLVDDRNEHVETFQLQLLCQHAEDLIIRKQKVNPSLEQLDLSVEELGNPIDIFENHYMSIIRKLPVDDQEKVRILIEDKLIVGESRVPLPRSVILAEQGINQQIIDFLEDKRLIRSEPNTVGGISLELSHDTLVAAILRSASARREEEALQEEKLKIEAAAAQRKRELEKLTLVRQRRWLAVSAVFLLITLGMAAFGIYNWLEADKQREIAEGLKDEAEEAQHRAELSRTKAESLRKEADQNALTALQAKSEAEESAKNAQVAYQAAKESEARAIRESENARYQKERAEVALREAKRNEEAAREKGALAESSRQALISLLDLMAPDSAANSLEYALYAAKSYLTWDSRPYEFRESYQMAAGFIDAAAATGAFSYDTPNDLFVMERDSFQFK